MMLIDVPVGLMVGQVIADAGRNMLKSDDRAKQLFMRMVAVVFAFCFITPIVIYFYSGWPGWETNYFFGQADRIANNPGNALTFAIAIVLMSLVPALAGLASGRWLIRKGREKLLRASYIGFAVLILVIVWFSRRATFNIAVTREDYLAGRTFSFFENPFFIYWLVLTVAFYGSLLACYLWVRKRDKEA